MCVFEIVSSEEKDRSEDSLCSEEEKGPAGEIKRR
jgi:hypothetical protein